MLCKEVIPVFVRIGRTQTWWYIQNVMQNRCPIFLYNEIDHSELKKGCVTLCPVMSTLKPLQVFYGEQSSLNYCAVVQ
jgi:hypothetical protein